MAMREVSKEDFYGPIFAEKLNVHPIIVSDTYPYTQEWRFIRKTGQPLYGKSIGDRYMLATGEGAP